MSNPNPEDEELLYRPDGDLLRKLYPEMEVSKEMIHGFGKEKRKPFNPGLYVSFKNLNEGLNGEDLKPHTAIEIGIQGTF